VKKAVKGLDKVLMALGQAMTVAWALMLGALGFVLLLAFAAALVAYAYTGAIVIGLLLVTPLLLTLMWGVLAIGAALRDIWAELQERDFQTLWERSQGLRVVYKAYFG